MIKIFGTEIEQNRFPDNTLVLDIAKHKVISTHLIKNQNIPITWLYESDSEMFTIMCLVDILHRNGFEHITLTMPYLCNARMDRIKNSYENFSLKVFTDWLNSLHFDKVITYNVHSNVSEALINNIENHLPEDDIKYIIHEEYKPDMIFFPDEGACKRYSDMKIIKELGLPISFGIKRRDWKTGKILGLDVIGEDFEGKNVLIIDDICSAGGTFKFSAIKLKELGAKDVQLYITPCENTIVNGELLKTDLISKIYTTNSICKIEHDKIKIIHNF